MTLRRRFGGFGCTRDPPTPSPWSRWYHRGRRRGTWVFAFTISPLQRHWLGGRRAVPRVVFWAVDLVPDRFGPGSRMTAVYDRLDRHCCLRADLRVALSHTAPEARDERHRLPPVAEPVEVAHGSMAAGSSCLRPSGAVELPAASSPCGRAADACVFLMEHYDDAQHINVGTGVDVTIQELADTIRDPFIPRLASCSTARNRTGCLGSCSVSAGLTALGWKHSTGLSEGTRQTYDWFRAQDAAGLRAGAESLTV